MSRQMDVTRSGSPDVHADGRVFQDVKKGREVVRVLDCVVDYLLYLSRHSVLNRTRISDTCQPLVPF